MPNILPTLAAPAKNGAAAAATSRAQQSRKADDSRGEFDQALSGARKKEPLGAPPAPSCGHR